MLKNLKIRQIAYYVKDVRAAADRHHSLYGSGPFFLLENATFPVVHRGREAELTHSAAFGQ